MSPDGGGMSIFKERTNLKLVNTHTFTCGIVAVNYEPLKK
jgi:hypothetical protein